ncbi:fimbrial protein [Bacillus sp. DNRA2]|uniref:fimbrial protein n=1 Tax=Bacillus sp. DNRA2 TaxID=2723053 RepID=UPI00145DB5F8|nr:fimbrial protein [Bacillus sp. DNRA2]NMD70543.1 fimbrial protein [Bacillus sp. DNRA2]
MLVEINLLPRKEPKSIAFLVIISSALVILLLAGLLILWQGSRLENELNNLNSKISSTQKLVQAEQAKLEKNKLGTESYTQLDSAVKWANDEPIKSAPILKRIVALLPERGFIQNISYAETGNVTMTVQFDSSREAAYFYKTLLDADWITGATLSSLAAAEIDDNGDSKTDTNTADNEQILPRYTGQYTLTLNRNIINSQELAETQGGGNR